MIYSHHRGHPIEFTHKKWRYSDDKTPIQNHERPCTRCGRMPTPEGYDACLGHLKGVTSACCGHGIHEKTIIYSFAKKTKWWLNQPGIKDWVYDRDKEWIKTKNNGHYFHYHRQKSGRTILKEMGETSKLKIFWYNIILFIRYLDRATERSTH